jgi:hypothetical protein
LYVYISYIHLVASWIKVATHVLNLTIQTYINYK